MPKKKSVMARALGGIGKHKGKRPKRMLDRPYGKTKRKNGMVDAIANRASSGRIRRAGVPRWAAGLRAPSIEHYIDPNNQDGVATSERRSTSFFGQVISFFETWRIRRRDVEDQAGDD